MEDDGEYNPNPPNDVPPEGMKNSSIEESLNR
jgi:hypothetical protein